MGSAIPKEAAVSLPERESFYKCPIGGFASLRPGICPKCHESLTPVTFVGDVDGRIRGSAANRRRALVSMPDGPDFQ